MTLPAGGLFERLMDQRSAAPLTPIEQIKDEVARALEALLNTRLALPAASFDHFPLARGSILNYGLRDFAGFCLSSDEDRAAICASLKAAIELHEPRLQQVSAQLMRVAGSVNRLDFVIDAQLALDNSIDSIHFSAVLQPSTLHYAITKVARPPR